MAETKAEKELRLAQEAENAAAKKEGRSARDLSVTITRDQFPAGDAGQRDYEAAVRAAGVPESLLGKAGRRIQEIVTKIVSGGLDQASVRAELNKLTLIGERLTDSTVDWNAAATDKDFV